jgi:hypothetical protein
MAQDGAEVGRCWIWAKEPVLPKKLNITLVRASISAADQHLQGKRILELTMYWDRGFHPNEGGSNAAVEPDSSGCGAP